MKPGVMELEQRVAAHEALSLDLFKLLRGLCSDEASLGEIVQQIKAYYSDAGRSVLEALEAEVLSVCPDAGEQASGGAAMGNASPGVMELEWFCLYLVADNLVPWDTLLSVYAELGDEADIMTFAQYIIQHDLCDDFLSVQDQVDKAIEAVEEGKRIPAEYRDKYSVFHEGGKA